MCGLRRTGVWSKGCGLRVCGLRVWPMGCGHEWIGLVDNHF